MKNNMLFLLLQLSFLLAAQEENPLWVQFQEAKELFHNGEFQESLDFFVNTTKSETPYPEAEYMIGLIYLEEGELAIAKEQILKAIDLSIYLEVPQDLLSYKYKLSEIYLYLEDYQNYISTLKDIIGGDNIDINDIRDQKAYYDTLITSGFDRLLHLYRKDADNVLNARVFLGYYYNSIGEYKKSVNYLLTPMLALITQVINDNIKEDREYIYTSMTEFFNEVKENKRAITYFKEHDFYKLMYFLAESLYGLEYVQQGNDIWTLLANSSVDSMWVTKSKRQLLNPTLEKWKFIY